MEFEWDPAKRRANLAKHGIDFVDAVGIFQGATAEAPDTRRDFGEGRIVATGDAKGRIITVIYTVRATRRRIISARPARPNEKRAYRSL